MVDDSHFVPIIGKTKALVEPTFAPPFAVQTQNSVSGSNEFYPNAGRARSDITLNQFLQKNR